MRYEDRTFEGETIALDDNEFVGCVFKDCTLRYEGVGATDIVDTRMLNSNVEMVGAAKAGADLWQTLFANSVADLNPGARIEIGGRTFQLCNSD